MTLDELRLRLMAAFPGASIEQFDAHVSVTLTPAETIAGWPTDMFDCQPASPAVLMSYDIAVGNAAIADMEAAGIEIARRILAVSAHQLIAARRRLYLSEPES